MENYQLTANIISGMCLTIVGIILTAFGIIFNIYTFIHEYKMEKERRSITWADINTAANNLAKEIKRNHKPDVIYIPNIKSGILIQFIKDYFDGYIPIIVGQAIQKNSVKHPRLIEEEKKRIEKLEKQIKDIDNYWKVDTSKWSAYVPKSLLKYKNEKILILDNLVLTGDFLKSITSVLKCNNIKNIEAACIGTTKSAIEDNTAPKFYWRSLPDGDIYMPWGK